MHYAISYIERSQVGLIFCEVSYTPRMLFGSFHNKICAPKILLILSWKWVKARRVCCSFSVQSMSKYEKCSWHHFWMITFIRAVFLLILSSTSPVWDCQDGHDGSSGNASSYPTLIYLFKLNHRNASNDKYVKSVQS